MGLPTRRFELSEMTSGNYNNVVIYVFFIISKKTFQAIPFIKKRNVNSSGSVPRYIKLKKIR